MNNEMSVIIGNMAQINDTERQSIIAASKYTKNRPRLTANPAHDIIGPRTDGSL